MSSSNDHSRKAIFDVAKLALAGSHNFLISQARMMDVLIRAKLRDHVSGERIRAKLRDLVSSEKSRSKTAYGAKLWDVESGEKSRSETAYVTIHRAFGAKKLQGFPKDVWAFDSGASKHMCHELNAFISYRAFDDTHIVELGDAHCISAHGIGSINLIEDQQNLLHNHWS
jgi:hypothetical protein